MNIENCIAMCVVVKGLLLFERSNAAESPGAVFIMCFDWENNLQLYVSICSFPSHIYDIGEDQSEALYRLYRESAGCYCGEMLKCCAVLKSGEMSVW